MLGLPAEVLGAIVAGVVSLFAAVMALAANRSAARLTARLDQEGAAANARRDYEYEALRRLYSEFEPLRFQLLEAADNARDFIGRLALREKAPQVPGSLPRGNYLQLATIYHLLLPSVLFRILRRRLTLVDLEISTDAHLSYQIARQVYLSFTRDADIANLSRISYTPYIDGWREKRTQDPHQFRRQGFALGRLDNALDALTTQMGEAHERHLSFGEFEQRFAEVEPEDYSGALGAARDLFLDFTIASRPVLWRLLVVQYLLYDLLAFVREANAPTPAEVLARIAETSKAKSLVLDTTSGNDYTAPTDTALLYLHRYFFPQIERLIGSFDLPPNNSM